MGKYENDVKRLLELVGGKKNIQAVSHCMTRMRFVLVDSKKANEEEIEDLPSVKGTFTQAGQYQVIIGNDVAEFYNEFTAYAGIEQGCGESGGKDEPESAAEGNGDSGRDLCASDSGTYLRRPCAGFPKCDRFHRFL